MAHELAVRDQMPARLNDLVSVSAEVVKMGRARLVFSQRATRDADALVDADVTIALVDRDRGRPARMPQELKMLLRKE